jgi:cell division protein FtsL
MARKPARDVEELVYRAQSGTPDREHRYVYGEASSATNPSYAIRPNKKAVGRKVSTFYVIVILFGFGIAIVAYINNIIAVNKLSAEINQLQAQFDKIANGNAVLKAEVNRKSGWERIGKIANEQIGLRYPAEQARIFDIDEELIDRATTISSQK